MNETIPGIYTIIIITASLYGSCCGVALNITICIIYTRINFLLILAQKAVVTSESKPEVRHLY